jgi:thiamine-phosphate pyrophosphorylase
MKKKIERVQYICHSLRGLEELLAGGMKWAQLRLKNIPESERIETATLFVELCNQYNAVSIINDYPKLAMLVKAKGVHLGQEDLPIREARALMGDQYIIGATANNLQDMLKATKDGADYIGLGPYSFTTTKNKLSPILGLSGFQRIMPQYLSNDRIVPVIAIGGILPDDVMPILETGIAGIAVSSFIEKSEQPGNMYKTLEQIVQLSYQ